MKPIGSIWLALLLACAIMGCTKGVSAPHSAQESEAVVAQTIRGGLREYSEMSDGTWRCGEHAYRYRLEISGRMPDAAVDSTFVYLSNLEEISFEQAWKAAGFSSSTEDYFSPEEATLVEWETDRSPIG